MSDLGRAACFEGFGFEWDSRNYTDADLDAGKWNDLTRIVAAMRPGIVRVMIQAKWHYRGPGQHDWDSPDMRGLVRLLKFCQHQRIAVILCDWGCEPKWLNLPGITGVDEPDYLDAVAASVEHLVVRHALTCIRYVTLVNEPNHEVGDFDRWARAARGLAERLSKQVPAVRMMGSDNTGAPEWLDRASTELRDVLGAYDFHRYASRDEVRTGALQSFIRGAWDRAIAADPDATTKPRILAEAGLGSPGSGAASNPLHDTDEYALYMVDYAIQAVAGGCTAVLAWMLDDDSHPGFTWGMLHGWAHQHRRKPWFHTWSALCRAFPPGCTFSFAHTHREGVRQMLGQHPNMGASWCAVNHSDDPVTLPLPSVTGAGPWRPVSVQAVLVGDTKAANDVDAISPLAGATATVPPRSALVLSTQPTSLE